MAAGRPAEELRGRTKQSPRCERGRDRVPLALRSVWTRRIRKIFNDLTRAAGHFDVAGDGRLGLEEAVAFDAKPGNALEFGEFL